VGLDEAAGYAFFSAVGKEQAANPYYHQLYKVCLDGGAPVLTPTVQYCTLDCMAHGMCTALHGMQ
jgi:hypothetical protein